MTLISHKMKLIFTIKIKQKVLTLSIEILGVIVLRKDEVYRVLNKLQSIAQVDRKGP